ncbi:hypothetical protein [Methylobacterium sp. GC_Met_2]|uniref:hypothetical protein n=1 Tax=Methylobacterium sp. GC_Met_2 TaxID=2937376 RepID=UPI00226B3DA5|nr:hypothetical protein [Methylobacterium sp. GC_Met_2]
MRIVFAVLISVMLLGGSASAEKLVAVCTDIGGYRVDDTNGQLVGRLDKLTDVSWSYTGDDDTSEGLLILQSSKSAGGRVVTEKAYVKRMLTGHWSFVSVLDDATWVHTIYPRSGKLLVTQNTSTAMSELSGKMLTGVCKVTVR